MELLPGETLRSFLSEPRELELLRKLNRVKEARELERRIQSLQAREQSQGPAETG